MGLSEHFLFDYYRFKLASTDVRASRLLLYGSLDTTKSFSSNESQSLVESSLRRVALYESTL